jgi:signal transduction histidine kinase
MANQPEKRDPKEELVDKLVEFVAKSKASSREQEKTREQIQQKLQDWEKDHKRLLETNLRLSNVNAESAELMAELEFKNQSLGELNKKLAEANASSANMMVEIEEKNETLAKTNKELARANAHAAELMAIIETKDEDIQELNKSLSGANARSANLVADLELKMIEIKDLNKTLTKEIEIREVVEQDLRTSNATKDKFFSIIAHDLRHPFNSIGNFVTLMSKHSAALSKSEIISLSKELKENTDKTRDLLENLLQWAQTQRGTTPFKQEVIVLAEIAEEIVSLLGNVAKEKNIRIESNITSKTLIFADWHMVNTILRNLVSNAIKFTPEDGNISLRASENEGKVQITVNDNGVGMSKATIEKLFRVDQQVVSRGTANEKGTGLGLILCKELVEKNGGTIFAMSEQGKGSTFAFTLPISP